VGHLGPGVEGAAVLVVVEMDGEGGAGLRQKDVPEDHVADAGGVGDVVLHHAPGDAIEHGLAPLVHGARLRFVPLAVRAHLHAVEPAGGDDGVGLLHFHARPPVHPGSGEDAAEVADFAFRIA